MNLTPREVILASLLATGRRVTSATMTAALFSADPNGGPNNANGVRKVALCGLRKKVKKAGFDIPLAVGGPGAEGAIQVTSSTAEFLRQVVRQYGSREAIQTLREAADMLDGR